MDDLDALVLEMNAGAARPRPAGELTRLHGWLEAVVAREASDLLLVAGAPPSARIHGVVVPLDDGPLSGDEIEDAVLPALPAHARRQYRDSGIADASVRTSDGTRFRTNLHRLLS
jgi:Tfp pilus assembly ATPase PilU